MLGQWGMSSAGQFPTLTVAPSCVGTWTPIQHTVPWVNPSPRPKRHLDQFSCVCTAYGGGCIYFTMGRSLSPQNCPFAWGIWTSPNTWLFWLTQVHIPNGISIVSAVLQDSRLRQQTDQHSPGRYVGPTDRPGDRQTDLLSRL